MSSKIEIISENELKALFKRKDFYNPSYPFYPYDFILHLYRLVIKEYRNKCL